MPDYIPQREAEAIIWLTNFNTFVQANGPEFGLTPAQMADLQTAVNDLAAGLINVADAEASFRSAVAAKNANKADAITLARQIAQFLQNNPSMTDAERGQAGLTIPDTIPTPGSGADIPALPPPLLLLDFSQRNQVTIHWGTNPGDERQNAKPSGVLGVQIDWARGGIPANESSWAALDRDTASPYVASFTESTSITVAFRARWIGKDLSTGPAGDPVTCSLTV